MAKEKSGSKRINELLDMNLGELTKIYNEVSEVPVKKLKCSKMDAALKIYKLEGGDEKYPSIVPPKTIDKPLGTKEKTRKERLAEKKEKKKTLYNPDYHYTLKELEKMSKELDTKEFEVKLLEKSYLTSEIPKLLKKYYLGSKRIVENKKILSSKKEAAPKKEKASKKEPVVKKVSKRSVIQGLIDEGFDDEKVLKMASKKLEAVTIKDVKWTRNFLKKNGG